MPHIIAIEYSDAQRRQLNEQIISLEKKGWPLSAKYDAQNFGTWQKLFENAINPGLFSEREIITVENAETFKEFPDDMKNLLEKDDADTIIILLPNTDAKFLNDVKDLITVIKPEAQISPWKRQSWLISLAKENGFKISPDAAQMLADNIEAQEELRAEIQKLALYSREIKISDVENLSFDEGGRALMIFLDGICDNKPADVARALKFLRASPILPTLTALTNRLRPALFMTYFQGKNSDEAVKILGTKNYALMKAKSALKNFGPERIKKFMAGAVRLSYLEKTNRAESWQGFEIILWELMMK